MQTIRVLVFPCGSEIGLELHRSFKDIRFIELHGAASIEDHGSFVYRNYHGGVPFLNDPAFDDEFVKLVTDLEIDAVFPALDDAIVKLADIADKLPCKVISASQHTADVCRDKEITYELFKDTWFNPKTYTGVDDVPGYPVIIKPAIGQGSAGFKIINSAEELAFELSERSARQVICEYLPGEEYTIDCFTNRHGELLYSSQRVRNRRKMGISVNTYLTAPDEVVRQIGLEINKRLDMRGMWFFQLKRNVDGEYRLLEVAPRVAGSMGLNRAVGVNLPLLAVMDAFDIDVSVMPQFDQCTVDRALDCVFKVDCSYDEVYLDFDDTLVKDGKVLLPTVAFLYQCHNEGVAVHLLSRHTKNIHESLVAAGIGEDLFASITVIDDDEKKSSYIKPSGPAIFIDDSFAERKDVFEKTGVKVFGLDNLDVLIDHKG